MRLLFFSHWDRLDLRRWMNNSCSIIFSNTILQLNAYRACTSQCLLVMTASILDGGEHLNVSYYVGTNVFLVIVSLIVKSLKKSLGLKTATVFLIGDVAKTTFSLRNIYFQLQFYNTTRLRQLS